jgi:hypothetical protein
MAPNEPTSSNPGQVWFARRPTRSEETLAERAALHATVRARVLSENKMTPPYVAFFVNDDGELISMLVRDDPKATPMQVPISLAELAGMGGFDQASRAVGAVVLNLIFKWHPEIFAEYPTLREP